MDIRLFDDKQSLGAAAAAQGAAAIRNAIAERGEANIIVATGASQFEVLGALVEIPGIDWSKVSAYHLDEYVGLPKTHPASFRGYLQERFVSRVPGLAVFTEVTGDAEDLDEEIVRLNRAIDGKTIDVCFAGIGENCHLAFNDPPADFDTRSPYIVVELDEGCRRQQLGEGWFPSLEDVPAKAISMSIQQILKSDVLVISVPDERKAVAVQAAIEGPITPDYPASILKTHSRCTVFLDRPAASRLSPETLADAQEG
ncbi:glucosamine-6-phosphate deaminase [Microvirga pudoricolor]|uniref:glucosamine-6-phosphate deaminase n=1 Tax=Microvirga pudoricolor TaxID=2778729 RepID=UPI001951D24B|nr:glucosamine-6-phosphate deaminase [Microvirga pudoricolor]MBM6592501.1 glucosamine-6-phosphate deaminase [Microvirga pudoricolor]